MEIGRGGIVSRRRAEFSKPRIGRGSAAVAAPRPGYHISPLNRGSDFGGHSPAGYPLQIAIWRVFRGSQFYVWLAILLKLMYTGRHEATQQIR